MESNNHEGHEVNQKKLDLVEVEYACQSDVVFPS
jgi:hypothetical protein